MAEDPTRSRPVEACQVCGSRQLGSVLFLGYVPPVNTMAPVGSIPRGELFYPLSLLRCQSCTLVQNGFQVDAKVLFPPTYPYRSASTRVLRDNFADLYVEANKLLSLQSEDLVIDVGSNDGTLLDNFQRHGHRVLGIEPSKAAEAAQSRGIPSLMAFFSPELAADVRRRTGRAKLITATNVFAHMGDVTAVVQAISDLLTEDGVFVSESHYLLDLVETLQYDTIYHEHLRYYSLESLAYLLASGGLEVFHVSRIPTHGGSIRVYAARKGQRAADRSVAELLEHETVAGIADGTALGTFRTRVVQSKLDLHSLLAPLKRDGARIYGVGAPSRASTLVCYTGLDDGILQCVLEIATSAKINRYIPGTVIPVLDEEKLFLDPPDYALLLSWHIAEELMANLRRKGFAGSFIVPLPEPVVID